MAEKTENEMSFLEHLEVLRWHIIRALLGILIIAIVAFVFKDIVFNKIILAPKLPEFIRHGMYILHYGHHENPNNIKLIFAPITFSVGLFVSMFAMAYVITFRLDIALLYTSAVVAYYIYYEWVHLGHHVAEYKPITNWSKNLKKAHLFHHYRNENLWWGITNSLGDYALGTFKKHEEAPQSDSTMDINR